MNKDVIYAIEYSALGSLDRFNLLLVAAGLRPSAILGLYSRTFIKSEEPRSVLERDIDETIEAIEQAGLVYETKIEIVERNPDEEHPELARFRESVTICVAKDQEPLDRLVSALAIPWSADTKIEKDLALGTTLGYPETAVKAFIEGRKKFTWDLPIMVQLEEPAQFVQMALSDDHWQDELKTIYGWAEAVKEMAPEVYFDVRNSHGHINKTLAKKVRAYISELEAE